jgi:hypothetical protein
VVKRHGWNRRIPSKPSVVDVVVGVTIPRKGDGDDRWAMRRRRQGGIIALRR